MTECGGPVLTEVVTEIDALGTRRAAGEFVLDLHAPSAPKVAEQRDAGTADVGVVQVQRVFAVVPGAVSLDAAVQAPVVIRIVIVRAKRGAGQYAKHQQAGELRGSGQRTRTARDAGISNSWKHVGAPKWGSLRAGRASPARPEPHSSRNRG